MEGPFWLSSDPDAPFPPLHFALKEPNGLLAVGGDLSPNRLLNAYSHGIFPWYSEGEPILWWSPAPRAVLFPDELRIGRSLRKRIRQHPFEVTLNHAFDAVIHACAAPRKAPSGNNDTWITTEMVQAYRQLHQLGHAHSVECWQGGELMGGLYGIRIGRLFCGESMFTRASDASRIALTTLLNEHWRGEIGMVDIQMMTPHLAQLGAREISRMEYQHQLARLIRPLSPPL
jgi:leucyl/phenylalanyl-tRNA--protein transferase